MREGLYKLMIKQERVQTIFTQIVREHRFVVNRHYQRKLVWTLKEKQSFIDSMIKGFPIPLFLFAENPLTQKFEIVDGLQRLDAIISFIKNEFSIKIDGKNYYCDVAMFNDENFTIKQRKPILKKSLFNAFCNCELPITVVGSNDEKTIIEIFERINSTGRKLSVHDLRQAGSVNVFSNLVSKLSASIRGDVSFSDTIDFCDMQKISINNAGLNYGIKINNVFWVKHDIITPKEFRSSKDEETLAQILSYILLGKNFKISSDTLNDLYDETTSTHKKAVKKLQNLGQIVLGDTILSIHKQIVKICECSGKSFTNLLFKKRDASGKSKIYVALFLAIWNLNQNGYTINDYESVALALRESGANGRLSRITEDNSWDSNIRKNAIRYFESVLKPVLNSAAEIKTNYDKQTSRILHVLDKVSDVGIENQMVEFKIGITTLAKNILNSSVIKKSIQTLVAMSNTVLDDYVYVILGIADNERSANDFKKHYGVGVAGFGNCLLSGVDAEVEKYYDGSLDNYIKQIQDIISHTHVSDRVKNTITSKISVIKVCGRTLVVLQFKNQNCPTNYDGAFWVRTFNSNKRIELNSEFYFDYVESHWG